MSIAPLRTETILHAGCKINLFLEILQRLDNGYHELRTLLFPLSDPCDLLHVGPAFSGSGLTFRCSLPELESKDNLVVTAYELFCRETGTRPDLTVMLEKHIPYGAGLGGGSSDAARLLAYLNDTAGPDALSPQKLHQTAAALGADVPFFLEDGPMWGEGTGTRLRATAVDLTGFTLLLICPKATVSTAWAYKAWDRSLEEETLSGQNVLTPSLVKDKVFVSASYLFGLFNSLESAVFPAYPGLREIKEQCLKLGAAGALMSGSGASVFALFRDSGQAENAARMLRPSVDAVFLRSF
jgi:4-diphosphocytidyl-2-C-methyl-D-erythritol kinase